MAKTVTIKLTRMGPSVGPFSVYDQFSNLIAENVSKQSLQTGVSYVVNDDVESITLRSTGGCQSVKTVSIAPFTKAFFDATKTVFTGTACLWRHLTNPTVYNSYYGNTEPYIIEYPFAYQYQDEILQNVKDYTKVYKYFIDPINQSNDAAKIELDNVWFNKAILYNGQQCSGILELVPKPKNSLKNYLTYPIYSTDKKTITYTKSDNFYQYNTFWSVVKDKSQPIFERTCESLSIDKVINQDNMDYERRSYKKETLRAKELKVRHILDNSSEAHLVSQFIIAPAQLSYK